MTLPADILKIKQWPNLATMFFEQAETLKDKPFLWDKVDGSYKAINWTDAEKRWPTDYWQWGLKPVTG